jgi:hypothetical protein
VLVRGCHFQGKVGNKARHSGRRETIN